MQSRLRSSVLIFVLLLLSLLSLGSTISSPQQGNAIDASKLNTYVNYSPDSVDDGDDPAMMNKVDLVNGQSLEDFEVTALLLASDIEGNIHALNRDTGELVWTLLGDVPLVEISSSQDLRSKRRMQNQIITTSMVTAPDSTIKQTSQLPDDGYSILQQNTKTLSNSQSEDNNNGDLDGKTSTSQPVELTWMVEPYEGGTLYYFTQENGLEKLPTSVEQLIAKSPFSLGDDFVYTGLRKSGFVKVDARTGSIIKSYGNEYNPYLLFDDEDIGIGELEDNIPDDDIEESEIPTILIGKTTYELIIHSRNNTSWNITYTTYGPNNLHSPLAYQNKESADHLYIQPFHDNSLLALDSDSKSVKWVSSLPYVTVNVFDVYFELNSNQETNNNNRFIILPHPFNNANERGSSTRLSTFVDKTEGGSWYALSDAHYPSLVKSAPLAKYISHERWRTAPIYQDAKLLGVAITGVHDDSVQRQKESVNRQIFDIYDPLRLPAYAFPTNIVEDYDRVRRNDRSRVSYQRDRLLIDGVPYDDGLDLRSNDQLYHKTATDKAFSTIENSSYKFDGIIRPILRLIYRAVESLFITLVAVLIMITLSKFGFLPVFTKILKRVAVFNKTQNGVDLMNILINDQDQLAQTIDVKNDDSIAKDSLIDSVGTGNIEIVVPQDDPNDNLQDSSSSTTLVASSTGNENKKKVTISDTPEIFLDDGSTNPDELEEESKQPRKRKRGSRGGRKNKKKDSSDQILEIDNNEESLIDLSIGSTTSKLGSPLIGEDLRSANTNSTNSLIISDTILGYGSHGTVVFKGSFEQRPVAVKRMLIDFYDVASHEINLLLESDDHPNVVRYFCSQQSDRFLYIALELCSASLEDVIEQKKEEAMAFIGKMNPVDVLWQIGNGLHHLHSLKIVHRDVKPQNILVVPPKKLHKRSPDDKVTETPVRLLISDFGLCKKLDADQSSFRATTAQAAGTSGWRAPELLVEDSLDISGNSSSQMTQGSEITDSILLDTLSNRRLTRSIDIFSLGCVFYYVLSGGGHPFGDRYMREGNIIKGEFNLGLLDSHSDKYEATSLISSMIQRDPSLRPDMGLVLQHPYFWKIEKKLDFLLRVSDRFEIERREPPSGLLMKLEEIAPHVVGKKGWFDKFDANFMDNLGKYRKYNTFKIMDLLRALRNKYHHYQDLPPSLARQMSPLPDGFYWYFAGKFPNILMEIYGVVCAELMDDEIFKPFF